MKKIILLVLATALIVAVCARPRGPAPPPIREEAPTAEDLYEGHIIEEFELEGYEADGSRLWRLSGRTAHVEPNTDVFIEKDVLLDIRGTTVDTDKVYWQNSKARFITNRPVKIIHNRQVIEGMGALGRVDQEFLQINQNIGMSLKGPVVVTCRGPLKIFRKTNRVIFYRDVMIRDTRGTLNADKLEIFVNPETNKIVRGVAEGNVRLAREGDVTYSDKAIYDTERQSVQLLGTPEIEVRDARYSILDNFTQSEETNGASGNPSH